MLKAQTIIRQVRVMDEVDRKIIDMLMKDGRVKYSKIARELGISDVAVIKRIRKLESNGIIRGYVAVVDPQKLGYKASSLTGVDVEPDYLFQLVEELKKKEYVRYLAITSGDHCVMTLIWAKDGGELRKIHDEISKMPGVKRVCPAIVLEEVKGTLTVANVTQ